MTDGEIENDIINDIKKSYGIICNEMSPVSGGHLNLKWKASCAKGDFLIKQFNDKRFDHKDLENVEAALQRQILLKKRGICCPEILLCKEKALRRTDNGTVYMVMVFCEGEKSTPQNITLLQMRSLGEEIGKMHTAFLQLEASEVKTLPQPGGYTQGTLIAPLRNRTEIIPADAPQKYRDALLKALSLANTIGNCFFEKFSQGWAHEDIQPGNILFEKDRVSAILDFDRCCHSYPAHDIGRAILSFALINGVLDIRKIREFIEGYTLHLPLDIGDIENALRLTWSIEAVWWLRTEFFGECDEIPKRFLEENLFTLAYWHELSELLT